MLLIFLCPGAERVLWIGTVGAGLGVCALYSNVLSMLAAYELLTASSVSAIAMSAALGHMIIPNLVGITVHAVDPRHQCGGGARATRTATSDSS